ncbi:MmpS family transport accessory protein [Nocardia paucivorans]|uniref:MmpS family transport accessory protein n=1 Tax=Nocardia paucivorans TaxID=114259 RepID=UPI0012FAFC93|nr:MmpS family transport accessory protein [Nocardia paucivorans]
MRGISAMSYPQPPRRKRRIWPWVLIAVVVLLFGGCFALVGTAAKEASEAIDSAVSSANRPPEAAGRPADNGAPPPLVPKPETDGKEVVYEIISDSGELLHVTYYDEMSDLQQGSSATAPWTKTVVNTSTYAIIGLGAQTTGTSVTCRITVDGKVKDEQTATGKYAVYVVPLATSRITAPSGNCDVDT